MTPLGHASISFLVAVGVTKIIPQVDPNLILIGTTTGGVIPDLDLLYRYIKTNGQNILDKNIGKHRYLPSHTPFFIISLGLIASILAVFLTNKILLIGIWFLVFGAILHLLLDTLFFPEGVNFIYPFSRKMTRFFYIKTPSFWAPKKISRVDDWHINYLTSPLFWISEMAPTFIAFVILLQ